MPNLITLILLLFAGGGLIYVVGWWLLIKTEGVYLGRWTVIKLYDLYASRYETIKQYEDVLEAKFLARPIMESLQPNNAPLVLDVATGTARLPRALTRHPEFHGRVIGVDLSRDMLHYGAGRVAEAMHYERAYLMHASAEKLPFPDNTFDLVTCLEALEFMIQPKQVIAELVRVLRPNGYLVVTNRRGVDAWLMPFKTWSPSQAYDIYEGEFGLENVEFYTWQLDYDLIWAQKSGESLPSRARPLEEIWLCPRCQQAQFSCEPLVAYTCLNCGQVIPIGKDGVIELQTAPIE